jgi:ketosteroid isomerase-like protein
MLRRAVQLGAEATNRGDFEAAFAVYHPDIELLTPAQFVEVGFDPVYRGREERVRFQGMWHAEWGEFRFEPEECIDLGDRVLLVGRVRGSGLASGAPTDNEWADLITVIAGRAIREQAFFDHAQAFRAAGLE